MPLATVLVSVPLLRVMVALSYFSSEETPKSKAMVRWRSSVNTKEVVEVELFAPALPLSKRSAALL